MTTASGIPASVEPLTDLAARPGFQNSWFAIGHFQTATGEELDTLAHILTFDSPRGAVGVASVSFANSTTGEYHSGEVVVPVPPGGLDPERLHVHVPGWSMEGTLDEFRIQTDIEGIKLNLAFSTPDGVIRNGGTGRFPLLGMDVYQYSVPYQDVTGTISAGERDYEVSAGAGWMDRQWQRPLEGRTDGAPSALPGSWIWLDLNLSCGDRLSLWSITAGTGAEQAWATVLHPDGSNSVVTVDPVALHAGDVWTSPRTGKTYPTRLVIRIPAFDAELIVKSTIVDQEIGGPQTSHYEGASRITGTYRGGNVTGYTMIEIVKPDWVESL